MATTAEQSTFYIYTFMLQDLGVLVWDNVEKRVMVVTRYGHDDVKRFWKRQRQANS
jgi:transcription initiation factor TFIIH subunit 4